MNRVLLISLTIILILALLCLGVYFWVENAINSPFGQVDYPITIEIKEGSTLNQISNLLYEKGLISSAWLFKLDVRRKRVGEKIQAGFFTFGEPLSMPQLIKKLMTEGRLPPTHVLVPEGRTAKEIGKLLSYLRGFKSDMYQQWALKGKEKFNFAFSNSIKSFSLEGYLFPDTYNLDEVSADQLIKKQLLQFEKVFVKKYIDRCKELGLTVHEAVTLASIIERESGTKDEMNKVSSVFWNRLKAGWKLESCVTVGYIVDKPHTILTLQELKTDSPYNTYLYPGLPPGPICNPGKAAIEAALWPANTKYFFFVATGKGTNDFSETLSEHELKKGIYLKNGLK